MGIGAAVAAAGVAASVGGSLLSSSAASHAADTQAAAANNAAALTHDQYLQTAANLKPFLDTGSAAFQRLGQIYGLNSGPALTGATAAPPQPQSGGGGTGLFGVMSDAAQQMQSPTGPWSGGGNVLDYLSSGQTQLPGGMSLAFNSDSGQYMVLNKDGIAVQQGISLDTPMSQLVNQVAPGPLGQFGPAPQSSAASAPAAPASNPLAAYGLSGLTYNPADYGLGNGTFNPAAYGLGNGTFQPTQAQLESMPGYQFTRDQGLKAVQNSATARGQGVSGAALKAGAQYATGLADNTVQTQANIFNQNLTNARGVYGTNLANTQGIFQQNLGNIINPLLSYATLGENAGNQTGMAGASAVNAQSNLLVGGANALAAGQVGSANALSSGLSSAGQAPLNYMLYNNLLNGGGGFGGGGGGALDTVSTF